jgi:hypothetical protein
MKLAPEDKLLLPVVSSGAEYLVMGLLMRRNILTYKAPQNYEGYDLIAIHPDPRFIPKNKHLRQVRIQVKSRFQSDSNRAVLLKEVSLDAFDFLAVVYMNIGNFYGKNDGSSGELDPEVYFLPNEFVRKHHKGNQKIGKLPLKALTEQMLVYKGVVGIELVAASLGVERPVRKGRAAARKAN